MGGVQGVTRLGGHTLYPIPDRPCSMSIEIGGRVELS